MAIEGVRLRTLQKLRKERRKCTIYEYGTRLTHKIMRVTSILSFTVFRITFSISNFLFLYINSFYAYLAWVRHLKPVVVLFCLALHFFALLHYLITKIIPFTCIKSLRYACAFLISFFCLFPLLHV